MNCRQGNRSMLLQIDDLLSRLEDHMLQEPLSSFNGATIGQHFRHIHDFYDAVLKGIELGAVDYASRVRNPDIESYSKIARRSFDYIRSRMETIDESLPIRVLTDFSNCTDSDRQQVDSSAGRELMYAFDHAIHHLAIIKMGLQISFPPGRYIRGFRQSTFYRTPRNGTPYHRVKTFQVTLHQNDRETLLAYASIWPVSGVWEQANAIILYTDDKHVQTISSELEALATRLNLQFTISDSADKNWNAIWERSV